MTPVCFLAKEYNIWEYSINFSCKFFPFKISLVPDCSKISSFALPAIALRSKFILFRLNTVVIPILKPEITKLMAFCLA